MVLSRMDYCNSLFICSSQSTLSSSATCARRRCCKTSLWRTSSNTSANSPETVPLHASSAEPNSVQTVHLDASGIALLHSTSYNFANVVMAVGCDPANESTLWSLKRTRLHLVEKAITVTGPPARNALPTDIKQSLSRVSFCNKLKTRPIFAIF